MTVLRIIAELDAPVASDEPLHLDSLLIGAHPDMHGRRLTRGAPVSELVLPDLPIAMIEVLGERVYLASAWDIGDAQVGVERFVRRRDAEDVEHLDRPFSVASGPGKNMMLPLPTVEASAVSWLVVGRRRGVRGLLRYVRAIGSKRRHGYGVVRRWDVLEVDEPVEGALVTADGRAARWLPASWCFGDSVPHVEIGAVLPPYWHPERRTSRVRPGWPVRLRPEVLERAQACR